MMETDSSTRAPAAQSSDAWPYDAPWWLRYPLAMAMLAGGAWAWEASGWKNGWIASLLLWACCLVLARELLLAIVLAGLVGGVVWMAAGALAAIPAGAAIIIGAFIIASSGKK